MIRYRYCIGTLSIYRDRDRDLNGDRDETENKTKTKTEKKTFYAQAEKSAALTRIARLGFEHTNVHKRRSA